ncbi:Bgt-51659 [Blumeria graminis f. sp. tritici]|uniref:Bgt-51659 n=1 Tax=Blumeria graminis f. sp. tritici TaxID=62690 RepID=A0A9X9LA56_BLUGR|nr:Bgt-51659 [Blumeria graminis f. sp. tritici]
MFWGCFAGPEEGPSLFLEEWGSINSQKYRDKVVPRVDSTVSMKLWLSVMQDNGPAHAASMVKETSQNHSTDFLAGQLA